MTLAVSKLPVTCSYRAAPCRQHQHVITKHDSYTPLCTIDVAEVAEKFLLSPGEGDRVDLPFFTVVIFLLVSKVRWGAVVGTVS